MVRVLIAGVLALVISILVAPRLIHYLRARGYGLHIREEGPQHHIVKAGTPTLGGLAILAALSVAFLALSHHTTNALLVFFVTLGCAAIGFLDDAIKLTHKRSLGLNGRWKLLLLAVITVVVGVVTEHREFSTSIYLPVVNVELPLSWAWYGLLFLMIAGTANAVNFTDGLDGLAAGTGIIAVFTFTAMAVIAWLRSGAPGDRNEIYIDLSIFGAALIGAIVGFLWYNAWPAEIAMGDTGSMAIGGALASFAIVMKTEILLVLIGGIFVIEIMSVIIQVFSFKYMGRRVFLMAPIHHHFEMKAWSETKIVVRFWILCAILCALAFALYYRYYFQFFPKLTEYERDQWAEWLVEERYAGRSQEEIETIDSSLVAVRDRVLGRARIEHGDVVLDVGTGTGLLALGALELVGPDGAVICLDISVDCLEEIRTTTSDARLSFLVGDAEVLPLPDASADVCVLRSVLIYVRRKADAARELHRVLRRGGRVSLFEPVNRRNTQLWELVDFGPLEERVAADFRRRWPADDPMHDFDVDDMERWFADAGFREIDIDVDAATVTIDPEAALHGIGAPGKPSLLEAWAETFSPEEVEELVAAVRAAGPTTPHWPALYLAATNG